MRICVLPASIYRYCVQAWCPQKPEEGAGSSGTGVGVGYKTTVWVLGAKPRSSARVSALKCFTSSRMVFFLTWHCWLGWIVLLFWLLSLPSNSNSSSRLTLVCFWWHGGHTTLCPSHTSSLSCNHYSADGHVIQTHQSPSRREQLESKIFPPRVSVLSSALCNWLVRVLEACYTGWQLSCR